MKQPIKIKDLLDGNKEAVQNLYEDNIGLILKFVTINNCSIEEARDIHHQSLYLLLNGLEQNWIEPTVNLKLHQYSIARVLLQKLLESKKVDVKGIKHIQEFTDIDANEIEKHLSGVQNTEFLLKTLAEPGRTVLKENVANGLSLADISVRMNFTNEESAANNKYKAIQSLMESL